MIRLLSSRLSTTTRVCVQAHTPVASTFRSSAAAFGEGRRWCVLSRRDAPTLFRALETTNEEIGDAIRRKITEGLSPDRLQVIDTSGGCGSFFIVRVESNEFEEKSMVEQQKIVYRLLKEEMPKLHGIRIETGVHPGLGKQ